MRLEGMTASFGVASYREGEQENELVRRVDEALYRAQANGKNQEETSS